MEVLSFDITGKFAHFRKFYSNSTALSFTVPPRTTLMGMLASFMGKSKDSYYEDFASEHIRLGFAVKTNLKKSFHRMNFLSIKSPSDFRGKNGRIQTPFEVVTGEDLRTNNVIYRVFISCTPSGVQTFEKIKNELMDRKQVYNLTLGIASFSATIRNIHLFSAENIQQIKVENQVLELHSAANSSHVKDLKLDFNYYNFVEEDLLPADFKNNDNREVSAMNRVLFMVRDIPLKVKLSGVYYQLKKETSIQNIQFLNPVS